MRRGCAALAGVVAPILFLVGCSSNEETSNSMKTVEINSSIFDEVPADGVKSKDGLVTKDYTTGFLPGEPYRGMDIRLDYYASDIFQNQCMTEAGYEVPSLRTFDWNDPLLSEFSITDIEAAFTVEEAQIYGYHSAPESSYDEQRYKSSAEYYRMAENTEWEKAYFDCSDLMKTQEPFASFDLQDMPSFVDGVDELPEIRAAAEQWRECMKDLGIPDLPEFPGIADSLHSEFGLGIDDADRVASEKEIEVAVQDAQCRESSQYDRLLYDAHWVSQEKLIEKNSAEYKARLEHINTLTQAYKDYIENHNA